MIYCSGRATEYSNLETLQNKSNECAGDRPFTYFGCVVDRLVPLSIAV